MPDQLVTSSSAPCSRLPQNWENVTVSDRTTLEAHSKPNRDATRTVFSTVTQSSPVTTSGPHPLLRLWIIFFSLSLSLFAPPSAPWISRHEQRSRINTNSTFEQRSTRFPPMALSMRAPFFLLLFFICYSFSHRCDKPFYCLSRRRSSRENDVCAIPTL